MAWGLGPIRRDVKWADFTRSYRSADKDRYRHKTTIKTCRLGQGVKYINPFAKGSPTRQFALIYGVGVLVTALLSNDATAWC